MPSLSMLLILPAALLLAACGGGSGGSSSKPATPPAPAISANGIWEIDVDPISDTASIVAVVQEGRFFFLDNAANQLHIGDYTLNDDLLSGSGYTYAENGAQQAAITVTGTVVDKGTLSLTVTTGTDTATLDFVYDTALTERNTTLLDDVSTWGGSINDEVAFTISIDDAGSITGSYSDGCSLAGSATIASAGQNIYALQATLAGDSCAAAGSYDGFLVVADGEADNDMLVVSYANDSAGYSYFARLSPRGAVLLKIEGV